MSDTLLTLTTPTLPEGYCWPSTPQALVDAVFPLAKAVLPGSVGTILGVVSSNTSPTDPAVRSTNIWIQTDNDGNNLGTWLWNGSLWVRAHPIPPGGANTTRTIYVGSEASLLTYDGGVDEAITTISGPFWAADHNFDFCFPVGVGTNPVTYTPGPGAATVITLGEKGGEELHALIQTELPLISKQVNIVYNANGTQKVVNMESGTDTGTGTSLAGIGLGAATNQTKRAIQTDALNIGGDLAGLTVPHNTMPPFVGVFFIKRTARQFYTTA